MKAIASGVSFCATIMLAASPVWATPEAEDHKLVADIHVNTGLASVVVDPIGPSSACTFGGLIFFDPTTAVGRIWYATLLEAQSNGNEVTVSYERSGQSCTITQISIHRVP